MDDSEKFPGYKGGSRHIQTNWNKLICLVSVNIEQTRMFLYYFLTWQYRGQRSMPTNTNTSSNDSKNPKYSSRFIFKNALSSSVHDCTSSLLKFVSVVWDRFL